MNRQMTQGTVANNVQVIPATKRRVSAGGQLKKAKDIRVAAYGRVSTDELAQQTSYEGQKSYYTKLINEKKAGLLPECMQMKQSPAPTVTTAPSLIR